MLTNINIHIPVKKASSKVNKKREIFEAYAKREGFDPLIADEWYTRNNEAILDDKVNFFI